MVVNFRDVKSDKNRRHPHRNEDTKRTQLVELKRYSLQNIQAGLQQRGHFSRFAAGSFNMGCLSIRLFGFIPLKKRAKTTQVRRDLKRKPFFLNVLLILPEILNSSGIFLPHDGVWIARVFNRSHE
ncbi:MAG: hypothetical protein OEM61_06680 [Desulfobacteraceae bacterium]|nr:hypothetical protein [Desulfobacteraceae bacterium]